jgi:hypothetical protein
LERGERKNLQVNLIPDDHWERNLQKWWCNPKVKEEADEINTKETIPLTYEELKGTENNLHNWKCSRVFGLNLKLFKYGGTLQY